MYLLLILGNEGGAWGNQRCQCGSAQSWESLGLSGEEGQSVWGHRGHRVEAGDEGAGCLWGLHLSPQLSWSLQQEGAWGLSHRDGAGG